MLCILRLADSRLLYYPENENTREIMETVEASAKYVCEKVKVYVLTSSVLFQHLTTVLPDHRRKLAIKHSAQ